MIQEKILNMLIKNRLDEKRSMDYLVDVGAGKARYLKRLAKNYKNINFIALDDGYGLVFKPKSDDKNLKYRRANILKLSLKSKSSDITSAFSVLPSVSAELGFEGSKKAFSELVRITRVGGYVVFTSASMIYSIPSKNAAEKIKNKQEFENYRVKLSTFASKNGLSYVKTVNDKGIPHHIFMKTKNKISTALPYFNEKWAFKALKKM